MSNYKNPQVDGVHMHIENRKVGSLFFWYIWALYALIYMTKYCFSSALAPIVASGMLTKSQTGFIAASFHIVYAPLQILGGIFADRYNPERMIKFGLLGSAVANLIIFLNQSYYVMLFAWVFNAAAQFAVWPSIFKIMASQLPRSEKQKNGFYMSFSMAAGLAVSYIVAAVMPDWKYNFGLSFVVSLLLLVSMHFVCKKVDSFMVPDKDFLNPAIKKESAGGYTMKSLLLKSGLIFLILIAFLRTAVGQGSNTLAPIMLMENYKSVSASVGNLLNVFVIISGIMGTLMVKFVLYPHFVKNELWGIILCLGITIPLTVILSMIGKIPWVWAFVAICGISFFTMAASLYISYYNMHFSAFGKDGAVAGILNCAQSVAIIVQSYSFNAIADKSGWKAVSDLWIGMIAVAVILTLTAVPIFNKFKKFLSK